MIRYTAYITFTCGCKHRYGQSTLFHFDKPEELELLLRKSAKHYGVGAVACSACGNYMPLSFLDQWEAKGGVKQVLMCNCNQCGGSEVATVMPKVEWRSWVKEAV